ncbi:MAG: tetratricopeptide repeat protein [Deltaproteobacteria bacterium]|nr:tetratricopeptide repeat protein [Deltaproteobacteria bacterium]
MRTIVSFFFVVFLSCPALLWAEDRWEGASRDALLGADWRSVAEITRAWKEKEPDSAVAHWLAGYAGLATGDYRLATDGFGRLSKPASSTQLQAWATSLAAENPRNAVPLMLQGDALARVGKYDEALPLLDKAVNLDPQSSLAYNTRGVVRALANKRQEAMADFTEATRLSPQFADGIDNPRQSRGNLKSGLLKVAEFMAAHERPVSIQEGRPERRDKIR